MAITLSGSFGLQGNIKAETTDLPPMIPEGVATRAFAVGQSTNRAIYSNNATTWTESTLPASRIWINALYNPQDPGRIVAMGWGGTAYSTDYGATWSAGSGMSSAAVTSIAPVTNTVWIILADSSTNQYWKSTNGGQTWTQLTFPTGSAYNSYDAVGAGKGLAIVVTNTLTYYTTTNGTDFTTRTFPSNSGAQNWSRIRYANGVYVAMEVQDKRYLYTGTDGINWTLRDVTGGVSLNVGALSGRDIAYGNGTWLLVYDNTNEYFTSTDLSSWTKRTLPSSVRWSGVSFLNNQWVAIEDSDGGSNLKAVSSDGINWTTSSLAATEARWMGLDEVR